MPKWVDFFTVTLYYQGELESKLEFLKFDDVNTVRLKIPTLMMTPSLEYFF